MRTIRVLPILVTLLVGCEGPATVPAAPVAPEADPRFTLSARRASFLLGEPVLLDLRFRNTSQDAINVRYTFRASSYEAPLFISRDGERYREFPIGREPLKREGEEVTLGPNQALKYHYDVLGYGSPYKLAFAKAGTYRVYAVYPIWFAGAAGTVDITSNVVEIRILESKGQDTEVWRELEDPEFVTRFAVPERNKAEVLRLAGILRKHPDSGYAAALRQDLARFYFRPRYRLSAVERLQMSKLLGVTDVEAIADERLERKRPPEAGAAVGLDKILDSLSREGVHLEAVPGLMDEKITLRGPCTTIRECMRYLSDALEASWERRDSGYCLMPFNPDGARPSSGSKE